MSKAKILFLLTEDWFFCSHFIERAIAAQEAGYEVLIVAREREHGGQIRAAGLRFIGHELERRSANPIKELSLFWQIITLYRRERPDIVHHVSPKPILYGTAAALLTGVTAIVNAPIGMGYIFSAHDWRAYLLRPFIYIAYRILANPRRSRVIFENGDDLKIFVQWDAVSASDAVLIRGAGINLDKFRPSAKQNPVPVVAFVARMLRDKGVNEFVAAAHVLHDRGVVARFVLVGSPDPMNPTSITEEVLRSWHGKKSVEWWGWRENIPQVLSEIDVMCLPSYREGLPKSLLEAAACALPIVTTDTPGCREVVKDGDNGFLVPTRNVPLLAEAINKLLCDPTLRERMGERSREIAAQEFRSELVIAKTLSVYRNLLPRSQDVRSSMLNAFAKILLDRIGALFALIFFLPAILLIALLVRATSKGPAFHWSSRVGRHNRLFKMPKFRTMHLGTPNVASHLMTDSGRYLTPVGSFLRKTSLDELPQLWSILVGDMGVVGPRPALFNQDDLIALRTQHSIHEILPGLTGLAQINGRDELSVEEKVRFDLEYLQRQSCLFDLKILWITLVKVFHRENVSH